MYREMYIHALFGLLDHSNPSPIVCGVSILMKGMIRIAMARMIRVRGPVAPCSLRHSDPVSVLLFVMIRSRPSTINDVISIYGAGGNKRTIVFCSTKKECNDLCMDSKASFGGVGLSWTV